MGGYKKKIRENERKYSFLFSFSKRKIRPEETENHQ
jgi:hypothetical protein